jgi:hypothetical protein
MEIVIAITVCLIVMAGVFTMHRYRRIKRHMRLACKHRHSSNSESGSDAGQREVRHYRRMVFFERVLLVGAALVMIMILAWYLGRRLL